METIMVIVNTKTRAIEVKTTQGDALDDVAVLVSAAVKLYAQAKGIDNDEAMNVLASDLLESGERLGERYAKRNEKD